MERSRLKTYVGFAIKAGDVVWGINNLLEGRRAPFVLLLDTRAGADTRKKTEEYAQKHKLLVVNVENLPELTSKVNVMVIGVKNKELAKAIAGE